MPYKQYKDVPPAVQEELEEAFSIWFEENTKASYVAALYDLDELALEELLEDDKDFIEGFLYDRLQDIH